ncbi:MAG TPA: hypothetical protein VF659_22650 [Pyrinomonadaceae bacterium]
MKFQTTAGRLCALLLAALSTAFGFAGSPAFAQTTATTTSENIPFTDTRPNPCNGDLVTFQGTMHITNSVTTDASGGLHLRTHVNYQDVSGTGVPSGLNYRVMTTVNDTLNDNDAGQFETTVIQTVKLNSQGPALNYFLHMVFHITINANGETTSTVTETRIECRGRS